jgi:hypothetical protein
MQLGVAAGQECPQEPQFPGSELRLVQVPPQLVSGEQLLASVAADPSTAVAASPFASTTVLSGTPT